MLYITLFLVFLASYLFYYYFIKKLDFFKELDVPYLPAWPIIGNMMDVISRRKHISQLLQQIYQLDAEAKYVGYFEFLEPVFLLRDVELIKDITIKNFDIFTDHKPLVEEDLDPLLGWNIFSLKGQEWKKLRSTLTQFFTASKMKTMFHQMSECAEKAVKHIEELPASDRRMIETKDLFTRYTNDVLAICGFGFIVNSLENPKNNFYVLGKRAINMEGILALKMLIARTFPNLARLLRITLFDNETVKYFTQVVHENVEMRDEKGISRPDILQLLMDGRKTMNLDIHKITAQSFGFFFAGFDTTGSTICMIAQELAIHSDKQEKLQNEIDKVMRDHNGKPTYDTINGMLYLDAVYNEVSRLHGQGFVLDRVCKSTYELPPTLPGKKSITLKPGMRVLIPAHAIQNDSKYYENPNDFIPERYYGKKVTTNDGLNMSFGIGPRGCIGYRFAILETKILLVHLLSKFTFKPNEKTCNPTKYSKVTTSMQVDGGFWLSIEPRSEIS